MNLSVTKMKRLGVVPVAAAFVACAALALPVANAQQSNKPDREQLTYRINGTVKSPELDFEGKVDAGVVFETDGELIHKPKRNAFKDPSRAAIRFLTGAGGGVRGGVIDARGSYGGIFVSQDAQHVVLEGVQVKGAAFKGIHIMSDAEIRNCTVSSDINGEKEKFRPTSLLIDPGSKQASRVIVENFTHGLFNGSAEGQMVKIACTDYVRLTNIQTPVLDEDSVYSLSLGENLKTVVITDSTFPRLVAHFPDPRGKPSVDLLVYSGVTFGNEKDPPLFNFNHLNARVVVFLNCKFVNIQRKVIDDKTPPENIELRAFIGCTFETAYKRCVLIEHDQGNDLLKGKVVHKQCTFTTRDEGKFLMPDDWDQSVVELDADIDVEGLIRWAEEGRSE